MSPALDPPLKVGTRFVGIGSEFEDGPISRAIRDQSRAGAAEPCRQSAVTWGAQAACCLVLTVPPLTNSAAHGWKKTDLSDVAPAIELTKELIGARLS